MNDRLNEDVCALQKQNNKGGPNICQKSLNRSTKTVRRSLWMVMKAVIKQDLSFLDLERPVCSVTCCVTLRNSGTRRRITIIFSLW